MKQHVTWCGPQLRTPPATADSEGAAEGLGDCFEWAPQTEAPEHL